MDPLHAIALPTHGVLVEITRENSWESGSGGALAYIAYIATNSTQSLSFVSLQSGELGIVTRIVSRPAFRPDFQYGVVVEVHTSARLAEGKTISLYLAQAGATIYFPAQAIEE
jgi:hypothetical protein